MLEAFFLFNSIAVVIGISATTVMLILYLKTRHPKLPSTITTNFLLSLAAVGYAIDLYCMLTVYDPGFYQILWESINFITLGIVYCAPKMCRPGTMTGFTRASERFFRISAVFLGILKFVGYALRSPGFGDAIIIAQTMDLSLLCLYFGVSSLVHKNEATETHKLQYFNVALKISKILMLAMLPALLLIDFFGWALPFMAKLTSQGFSVMPAFLISFSLSMLLSSVKEILEPGEKPNPFFVSESMLKKYSISKREAEIAPLIVECLSYQEIADKLFISVSTVRSHIVHLYQKTNTNSRLELSRLLREAKP